MKKHTWKASLSYTIMTFTFAILLSCGLTAMVFSILQLFGINIPHMAVWFMVASTLVVWGLMLCIDEDTEVKNVK